MMIFLKSNEICWCAIKAKINLAKLICCERKYRQEPPLIPVIILDTIRHYWERTLCAYFFTVGYNKINSTEKQFAFHVEVKQKNEEKSLTFSEKSFGETIKVQVE